MELKDLTAFVVLAEELHFARAAARLHISAPPLTQRIKRLERELGVVLFERNNRKVALAPAGVTLLEEARILLERSRQIPQKLQAVVEGQTGRIRIGLSGSVMYSDSQRRLAAAIPPSIDTSWVVMNSSEQVNALRDRRLDIGLLTAAITHEGVQIRILEKEPLVVALPAQHRYAQCKTIELDMLRDDAFIISERHLGPHYYDRMIAACERAGFIPKVELQPQSLASYIGLIALGAGVTLTPKSLERTGFQGISFVRIEGQRPHAEVSLAWSSEGVSPATLRVLKRLGALNQPGIRQQL